MMARTNDVSWWTYLRRTIALCCFPVLTVIGGNVILLSNEPARETLEAFDRLGRGTSFLLSDNGYWMFVAALVYWSVSAWYCSRLLLSMRYPGNTIGDTARPAFDEAVRAWLPRVLGLLSVLPMTIFFAKHETGSGLAVVPGLFSILFLGFMVTRRPLLKLLTKKAVPPPAAQLEATSRAATIAISLMFFLSLLVLCTVWFLPPYYVRSIGAPALLLFAFGSWTLFGSIVLIHIPRILGGPSLTLLPLLMFLGFSMWNENHFVAQPGDVRAIVQRPKLLQDFKAWQDARDKQGHGAEPIYLVAAAGGASRAAYWTGLVLSTLESMARDCGGRFSENMYALSGVSGGSLGVAAFAGSLLDPDPDYGQARRRMVHFLEQDFLSPTIGYMLYPDLLARLSPFPCVACDRSRGLERTWDSDWKEIMQERRNSTWFSKRLPELNQLRTMERWVPNLFLNATSLTAGRRVVQSNIDFVPRQAYDIYDRQLDTARLALAGAVHNSARFAYVSPGGLVRTRDGRVWDYVVDGGYFENSGAATLNAMIDELMADPDLKARLKLEQFRVLIIENDPARSSQWICRSKQDTGEKSTGGADLISAVAPQVTPRDRMGLFSPELSIPVYTMFNVRTARAQAAEDDTVRRLVNCSNVLELRYPYIEGAKSPPMSWFLDSNSRATMRDFLERSARAAYGPAMQAKDQKTSEELQAFQRNWSAIADMAGIGTGQRISGAMCPGRTAAQAAP